MRVSPRRDRRLSVSRYTSAIECMDGAWAADYLRVGMDRPCIDAERAAGDVARLGAFRVDQEKGPGEAANEQTLPWDQKAAEGFKVSADLPEAPQHKTAVPSLAIVPRRHCPGTTPPPLLAVQPQLAFVGSLIAALLPRAAALFSLAPSRPSARGTSVAGRGAPGSAAPACVNAHSIPHPYRLHSSHLGDLQT